jgi:hypothetical protein
MTPDQLARIQPYVAMIKQELGYHWLKTGYLKIHLLEGLATGTETKGHDRPDRRQTTVAVPVERRQRPLVAPILVTDR